MLVMLFWKISRRLRDAVGICDDRGAWSEIRVRDVRAARCRDLFSEAKSATYVHPEHEAVLFLFLPRTPLRLTTFGGGSAD